MSPYAVEMYLVIVPDFSGGKKDAVLLFSICLGSELILIGVRRFYRPSVSYNLEASIVVATTFLRT
jgi:hypothetical protein